MNKRNNRQKTRPANTRAVSTQARPAEKKYDSWKALSVLTDHFGLAATDGYINPAARIGEASPLIAGGGFIRSGLTGNQEMLTTTYRVNWLAKRIIDTPAEDMTRAWYTLATEMDEKDLEELRKLEAFHSVKQEITNAIRWARLYGGSLALMVIRGEEGKLDQPLDMDMLLPECFQGLLVLDRTKGIEPSLELVADLDDPDFGLPEYYTLTFDLPGTEEFDPSIGKTRSVPSVIRIHHSRVLRFTGRELPRTEAERENSWGASELEHIWEALERHSSISANIAQLIFQANITTLKTNDLMEMLATGSDERRTEVLKALEAENYFRDSYGLQLLGAEDSMENLPYNFAGLPEIYDRFMMEIAGAAEIPATKLFGRSPQGMNATGESDTRNYYEMITSLQERMLRPALEKLLPVMAISCWGYVPEDMTILFEPVMPMSGEDKMKLAGEHGRLVMEMVKGGVITMEEARAEISKMSRRTGIFGGIGGAGT